MTKSARSIESLPAIPRDREGPVFSEPWEAQAFALAVRLSEAGHFTWSEWARMLSREIKAAGERAEPDLGDTYYHYWISALERICAEKGLVIHNELDRRKEEWLQAYLRTPHGHPIELSAAARPARPKE